MKYVKYAALIGALFLVCTIVWYYFARHDSEILIDPNAYYPISYVMDGDTFKVKITDKSKSTGKTITVRLLGINTPETVDPRRPPECYGKEASNETKTLLKGRSVRLGLNPDREIKDKYGRYLAYATRDDGLLINEYLIENGYAREYTYGSPYSLQRQFKASEALARSQNTGLWASCAASP